MNQGPNAPDMPPTPGARHRRTGGGARIVFATALVLLLGVVLPRVAHKVSDSGKTSSHRVPQISEPADSNRDTTSERPPRLSNPSTERSADQIVADKVRQFARSRRDFVNRVAQRLGQPLPSEVEAFFDALEAGDWTEIERQWEALSKRSGQYEGSTHSPELDPYWPAVLDAYGTAEQAHLWPAGKLLDYGNAILDALRPGMVYVGGTDEGRWIPTLLNETSSGPKHVVLTQNALADLRYLDFMNELYEGRMNGLTREEAESVFRDYRADARARLEHDQQNPDAPKQLRPGEAVQINGDQVEVSGQTAVMAINEKLLGVLRAKNPGLAFAVQESFPFRDTYADALPLGPLMELDARDGEHTFSPERAQQSLNYWREQTQAILADPESTESPSVLKSYSKNAVSAANLLAAHQHGAEAEEAYRLATALWPSNPEPAFGLANLYSATGRKEEARQLLERFFQQHPEARGKP